MAEQPLATFDGPTALITVIALQDMWRGLSWPQRACLIEDWGHEYAPKIFVPSTIRALTRKGLWGDNGITDLGRLVVQYRPKEATRG